MAIIIYNFTVIPMRVAFGCTLVAVSAAVQMNDYQEYFACVQETADFMTCYDRYLSNDFRVAPEPEPELISVVEEAEHETGRLVYDEGREAYQQSIARTFPFLVVDFNKSEKRDTGLFELGLKEVVVPEDKNSHYHMEPQQCFDPCAEMNEDIRELKDKVEFLEWRNAQAENLLARTRLYFG